MAAHEAFLGVILSPLERAVDFIIMAKWRGVCNSVELIWARLFSFKSKKEYDFNFVYCI